MEGFVIRQGRGLVAILLMVACCGILLFGTVSNAAAVECTVGGGTYIIGAEMVADECIPEGMNDDTVIHSQTRSIICDNGEVVTMPSSTVSQGNATPKQIISSLKSYPYKVFRNAEGSHIVGVHRYYFGTIDGQSMGGYSTGTVTTGLFDSGFILPDAPDCRGGDYDNCRNETPAGSTVNKGTGRYSHSQKLFTTGGSQPLSLAVVLSYHSFPQPPSAIGSGWSHSYEMSLAPGAGNSRVFWQHGKRRVYESYTSGFVAPRGDESTLVENSDGTFTLTEKNGWVRTFAADGRIASITDRNGNSLTFSYTDERLTSVTDANGRVLTLAYDGSGVLQSLTDPGGHLYTLNYTEGLLTSVLYPDGATWQYSYGSNNLLTSKSDPAGNLTSYVYDTANRVTQAVDPQNRSRSFGHAPQASPGKVPAVYPAYRVPDRAFSLTEQNGGEWSYQVDPSNEQVTSMTDPLGHETSYAYDSQGQLISKTEADVGTTSYTYDENGNLISMTDPAGQVTDLTYNDFGQVLTVSGAPGDYNFTYDQGGNLLTRTNPAGETTTYAYDGAGNLDAVTAPLGRVTTLSYDSANNPVTLTRPTGAVYALTYDAVGNLLTLSDPLNRVTTLTYDSRNRPATLTAPGGQLTIFTYDGNGNRAGVVDAKGNTTTYSYNHQRQVTAVRNALDHVTELAYVAAGCPSCGGIDQLTAVTAANGGQTQFAYNLIGRLTTSTDPIGATATYSYNAIRKPAQKTAGDGSSVSYSYDALQRLTGKTLSTGGSVTFDYDSRNNITSAVSAANSYSLGYDDANRLISVSDSRGLSLAYQYDAAGNRTALILQPGTAEEQTFSYSYDNGRRLTGMSTPAGTFSFAYDLADRRTRLDYPNGIVGSYSYDDANQTDWLTGIDYTDAVTGSDLLAVGYPQHDAVGNRLQRSVDATTTDYSYDATYQVTRAQTGPREENFSYDEVGNRESGPTVKDTAATAYDHNPANQMTKGRKFDYQYDARGNQVYRMMNSTGSKSWAYTWNAANQLLQADLINDGQTVRTVQFQYDAFGRRITKQTIQGGSTTTIDYYYDGEDIILQVKDDGTTSTTTQYVHGPGIDEPLAMIQDDTPYFYHADGLGSIVALTDSNKQIVQRYSYDTFGMLTSVQSPEFNNSYTFTAREWGRELGLYYYRARYYDPMEGRFISKDPIATMGNIYTQKINVSFSQYVSAVATPHLYTENNPINFIDPSGLVIEQVWKPLGGGLWGLQYHTAVRVNGRVFGFQNGLGVIEENPNDYTGWGTHSKVLDPTNNNDQNAMQFVNEAITGENPLFTKDTYFLPNNISSGKSCINFVDCLKSDVIDGRPCP